MNISKRGWGALWRHPGHLLWILAAYLPFLGSMSVPLTGDQKVYLSTAIEMKNAESWLTPLLFGAPSYFKPPIQYWATLIGWEVFGFNLWGALIPSVLCVLLTAWFMGEIVYMLKERRWFVNAGLWYAAALGTATYGSVAQMEIYLALFYAASWWLGLKYLAAPREHRRWSWIYLAFLVAGLSALVKSPLYSVFWVFSYVSYLLVTGEWEIFRNKHFYLAWFLGILAGASWFAAMLAMDGQRFVDHYFLQETLAKAGGNRGGIVKLWAALLYMCFPFTLLLFTSARAMLRTRRGTSIMKFVICWCWPPALFFTLYPYRVSTYLYILVPALAVLVDWTHFRVGRSKSHRYLLLATGALMALVSGVLAWVAYRAELAPVWVVAGFVLVGALSVYCSLKEWMRALALCGLAWVLLFRATAVQIGEWDIVGLRAYVAKAPDTTLAMLDDGRNIWHEVGLLSVALGQPIDRILETENAIEFVRQGGALILSPEQREAYLARIRESLGTEVDETFWSRWKTRGKFPYRELILHGRQGVSDFEERALRKFSIIVRSPGR